MQVREIMTPDPVACTPEDRVVTAAKIMRERDCGAVPVVDSQDSRRVWGILTDRDIVLRVVARERDCLSTTVGECMTPDVFTVRPTDDVADVVQLMERQQIRRVPVVEEGDLLVGIVATADQARRLHDDQVVAELFEDVSAPEPVAIGAGGQ
ncbi:MAG: CBS domain-containing protein [Armatimonadetes bacterium]|nr:CBS domain-containing protein [Armatimonadota bacterium]